jgi:EAL domain-containing protein (putative c-di-GMP-specific phosphodiesterase class I)
LSGEDPAPFRAQVIDMPPIPPQITEHRVHELVCALCWAHLKRDFIAIAERSGVSQALGEALLEQEKQLFQLWYQV